jgi:hypothetical protein
MLDLGLALSKLEKLQDLTLDLRYMYEYLNLISFNRLY